MDIARNTKMETLKELIGKAVKSCKLWHMTLQFQASIPLTPILSVFGGQDPTMNSTSDNSMLETIMELLLKDKKLNILLVFYILTISVNKEKN